MDRVVPARFDAKGAAFQCAIGRRCYALPSLPSNRMRSAISRRRSKSRCGSPLNLWRRATCRPRRRARRLASRRRTARPRSAEADGCTERGVNLVQPCSGEALRVKEGLLGMLHEGILQDLLSDRRLALRRGAVVARGADSLLLVAGRQVVLEESTALDGERGEDVLERLVWGPEGKKCWGHRRRQRGPGGTLLGRSRTTSRASALRLTRRRRPRAPRDMVEGDSRVAERREARGKTRAKIWTPCVRTAGELEPGGLGGHGVALLL